MAVKGLARLNRQFKALSRLQIEAARTSLHQNAEELSQAIQRAVPVDRGDLAASVGWSVGDGPAGALGVSGKTPSASQTLKDSEGLRVTVHAGNEKVIHARWVEFGTAPGQVGARATNASGRERKVARNHPGTPAQPFFYVTIMARKKRLKSRVVRNANKAAKLAAKVR